MYGFVNDNNIVTKRQTFARCSYTEHVLWDKLFFSLSSLSLFSLSLSLHICRDSLHCSCLLPLFFIVPCLSLSLSLSSPLSYKHPPSLTLSLGHRYKEQAAATVPGRVFKNIINSTVRTVMFPHHVVHATRTAGSVCVLATHLDVAALTGRHGVTPQRDSRS